MESLFILIPVAILFIAIFVGIFFWAVRSGQFEDFDTEARRILFDDDPHPQTQEKTHTHEKPREKLNEQTQKKTNDEPET